MIITMVNGNGQVTDLDEVMEDRCVVGTTGVCVWEQLNCKQGHGQHYTTIGWSEKRACCAPQ